MALHNDTDEVQIVPAGSRIAQLVILPFVQCMWMEERALDSTERGDGGFGSTGTK